MKNHKCFDDIVEKSGGKVRIPMHSVLDPQTERVEPWAAFYCNSARGRVVKLIRYCPLCGERLQAADKPETPNEEEA